MARRFRIESLPKEQQEKLRIFASQYFPGELKEKFIDSIENNGTITPDLFKAGNFTDKDAAFVSGEVAKITGGAKSRTDALKEYIASQKDVPNLTSADLRERVDIFKELGTSQHPEVIKGFGPQVENMSAQIEKAFINQGVSVPKATLKQISEYAINALKAGSYNPQQVANFVGAAVKDSGGLGGTFGGGEDSNAVRVAKSVGEDIPKVYTAQVQSKEYEDRHGPAGPDYSKDITEIEGILADRGRKEAAGADVAAFFASAPGEAASSREAFFNAQRGNAKDFVSGYYAPQARESLRARGLARSGQVSDAVVSKYADLFETITEQEAAQLQSDISFFRQQEYDKVFGDLVEAGARVAEATASARGRLRSEQIADFGKKQAEIESKFNLDLFKDQARAAYDTYQKQTAAQSAKAKKNQEADLVAAGAQTATTVALASLI